MRLQVRVNVLPGPTKDRKGLATEKSVRAPKKDFAYFGDENSAVMMSFSVPEICFHFPRHKSFWVLRFLLAHL